jgi:cyclopropane-fatty-acyl-phospholipid synthase
MSHATDRRGGHSAASRTAGPPAGSGSSAPGPAGRPPGSWPVSGPIDVDPASWPGVAAVPRSPVRAAIARLLFARVAARLPLCVRLPSGAGFGGGGPGAPVLALHRPDDFYQRVGAAGLIGFGESYMAGDWDADDLTGLLTVLARQVDRLVPRQLQWLRHAYVRRQPPGEDASETGALRNIQRHYDVSNELFALFLDETMTYSSALFEEDGQGWPVAAGALQAGRAPAEADLAAAQWRKIDRLLDETRVGPGTSVLEIGTGWGELAIRAAQRGARVRTVTISAEQRELASRRVSEAGLADRVSIELLDYRRADGQYDAIVSVEMIEAVAERYWPEYFAALDRLLAPGGRIGLQAITMPHHRMLATRRTQTWILKYIFPGGLIPSVTAIEANLAAHTGLRVADRRGFGRHYAETLRLWRERLLARQGELAGLGFDEVFGRMWRLYLCYSEAGFRSGYLDVSQFLLVPGRDEEAAPGRDDEAVPSQNGAAGDQAAGDQAAGPDRDTGAGPGRDQRRAA